MPIVVRAAGLVAGLAVAAALVTMWRVPGDDGRVGASVRLTATTRGELAVTPAGLLANDPALRPGDELTGRVEVRNITARPLTVTPRAVTSVPDLDGKLSVALSADTPFVLQPGQARTLRAQAWIPAGTENFEGRSADLAVTFDVEAGE